METLSDHGIFLVSPMCFLAPQGSNYHLGRYPLFAANPAKDREILAWMLDFVGCTKVLQREPISPTTRRSSKPMKQTTNYGICDRIAAAQSVEEIGALLRELGDYKLASQRTRNRAHNLARKRSNQLAFGDKGR